MPFEYLGKFSVWQKPGSFVPKFLRCSYSHSEHSPAAQLGWSVGRWQEIVTALIITLNNSSPSEWLEVGFISRCGWCSSTYFTADQTQQCHHPVCVSCMRAPAWGSSSPAQLLPRAAITRCHVRAPSRLFPQFQHPCWEFPLPELAVVQTPAALWDLPTPPGLDWLSPARGVMKVLKIQHWPQWGHLNRVVLHALMKP